MTATPHRGARTTVLIPSYNAEATVREAVESALGQTCGELEVVVVDDASSVPVRDVLADIGDRRLRVITRPRNGGVARARNTGLREVRTPLVSQLDADDLWEPDYLEHVLPCFEDPEIGLAYANVTILGHPEGHSTYIFDPSVHPMDRFPKIAEQNPVPALTATMRTDAVRRAGGWAPWLAGVDEYHLYCKLVVAGWRFAYVDRKLARYRWPEPSRGLSFDQRRRERSELLMWLSFVARHPLVPGPRRQVRTRLRRELAHAGQRVRGDRSSILPGR